MLREEDCYMIGTLGKAHGVRGEMLFSFSDDVWQTHGDGFLLCKVEGLLVPFYVEEYRLTGDTRALVKLEGIDSPDEAREMQGVEVYVPYSLKRDSGDETYSWQYFKGFSLRDTEGRVLGRIDEVDDTTENVLFCIGDTLIPAAEELIEDIDHDNRTLTMALPEGLTEI